MSPLEPGTIVDRWEVLDLIGEGGMATVYKVRHRTLGSIHALKVLASELARDSDIRDRFLAEGRIQATLRHPNIVAVTDLVAEPGIAGLIAEYIEGEDLESWIERSGGTRDVTAIKELFLPVLDALSTVHESGVLHRDIKPSNILLARHADGRLRPMLVDFGIAKVLDETSLRSKRETRSGARLGTVDYMSPEQVRGEADLDARTDVFAVAATLYEFVTGEVPFEGSSDFEVMTRIVAGNVTPLTSRAPGVDSVVAECIDRGLSPSRIDRFPSCSDFADTLGQSCGATTKDGATPNRNRPAVPKPPLLAADNESGRAHASPRAHHGGWYPWVLLSAAVLMASLVLVAANQKEPPLTDPPKSTGATDATLLVPSDASTQGAIEEPSADARPRLPLPEGAAEAESLATLVGEHLQSGRLDEALDAVDEALSHSPRTADLWALRGETLHAMGRERESVADYTRAIGIDPSNSALYRQRATVFLALSDDEQAGYDMKAADRLDRGFHPTEPP